MLLKLAEKMIDCFFANMPQKKPDWINSNKACLIAHRGAHNNRQGIIENTEAAFDRALSLGCWGIEFDVHTTADGILVVNHDPNLFRLWGKNLAICDLNFKTLRNLVPQIPSLSEVIVKYGKRMHLFIELKAPFRGEVALKEELQILDAGIDYHLLSLDEPLFASMTYFPKEIMLLVPVHNNVKHFCSQSLRKNYGGVLGHYLLLTNKKIKSLKLANKMVGVGLVDSEAGLYRALNREVFWVFSNQAELLSYYLKNILGK